jgi:hypothetical protein
MSKAGKLVLTIAIFLTPALLRAADDPEVETLFKQLSAEEFKTREAARKALIDRGEEAIPQIKALAEKTQDPETKSAVAAILKAIEVQGVKGPTFITLDVKDAAPKDVIDEIVKQSQLDLRAWPEDMWKYLEKNKKVTISVKRQPFWAVMKEVLPQTGLQLSTHGFGSQLQISRGNPTEMNGPASLTGPCMVIATMASDTKTILYDQPGGAFNAGTNINANVYVEPKLKILSRTYQPTIEEFEDDAGHSLLTPRQDFSFGMSGQRESIFNISINVPNVEGRTKKVKILKGYLKALVQTKSESIEVKDIKNAKATTHQKGDWTMTVDNIEMQGDPNNQNYVVHLTFINKTPQQPNNGGNNWRREIGINNLALLDADGKELTRQGHGMSGDGTKYTGNFRYYRGAPNSGVGEPAKLVWTFPTEAEEVKIPFEFKDLALP